MWAADCLPMDQGVKTRAMNKKIRLDPQSVQSVQNGVDTICQFVC